MKRVLTAMIVLCLLLGACGQPAGNTEPPAVTTDPVQVTTDSVTEPSTDPATEPSTEPATEPSTEPSTEPATEPATEPSTEPETEPTEAPVLYRNPLNGEPLDEPYVGRAFAVTINNVSAALPHRGVSEADVFFELFINDYCTRGLALFSNVAEVESIGSIRSTRYNFTDLALAYDLIVVHAQASDVVLKDMKNEKVDNLNADSSIGYRDSYRYKSQGYAWEHTLFAKGESLVKAAEKKGFDLKISDKDYGMNFVEDGTPVDGEIANEIDITFTLNGHKKYTTMKYDPETREYVYHQFKTEQKMTDENNGEPESFTNVIVILATVKNDSHGYHVADLYGSGDGYFACGGKIIPIKWTHEKEKEPFTFTLLDGTPLYQGVGSTYVAIAPKQSPVEYK